MNIAFISCHDHGKHSVGYIDEESMLLAFLQDEGLTIKREVWNDASVDWTQYDLAILKSPWDYHEHIGDFLSWLDTLQKLQVRLLNPVEMVRWNCDKHYLKDIEDAGLNIIPSLFLEKCSKPHLLPFFEQLGTEKLIIKPCVSAGAKNTNFLRRDTINEHRDMIYQLLEEESYIVQPFMKEIFEGEWSFIFFNGKFGHSILKVPLGGDYRTQHYHGGVTKAAKAEASQIESVAKYVQQFGRGALYARVDGVMREGQFLLMELELVEPYLYLDIDINGYANFYEALTQLSNKS
jgi:glutathione synthase/RimK-type ligase-like ATP-grasp enzyme